MKISESKYMQEEGHDLLGECSDNRNNYNRSIKKESIQEEEQDPLDECNHNEEGPDPQIICIQEDRHEPLDKYTDKNVMTIQIRKNFCSGGKTRPS